MPSSRISQWARERAKSSQGQRAGQSVSPSTTGCWRLNESWARRRGIEGALSGGAEVNLTPVAVRKKFGAWRGVCGCGIVVVALGQGLPGEIQGSDGVRCWRLTRMVGPPSEELNCFDAMKLRIQWLGAESPPLRVVVFNHGSSPRIRQVRWLPGQFKPCRLRNEQKDWFTTCRVRPAGGRP